MARYIEEYQTNALTAVTFNIVYNEDSLKEINDKCTFKPEMAHQVFGEGELIFGYTDISINLHYLHNSSQCFMEIKYSEKINNFDADDVVDLLNSWLPTNFVSKKADFMKIVKKEKHDQMFGTLIHQFERSGEVISLPGKTIKCQYKITQCDQSDKLFQDYHQRFETFIIWFIDAANFIDLSDERWLIFYIYEEYVHPETKKVIITPVGYTAIYKFFSYPNSNRARISQFFILPTHQRKGLGRELYKAVYEKIVKDMPDVVDITVEDPSEPFQKMRDICDSIHIFKDLQETKSSLTTKSPKVLRNYMAKHKICKRQAGRLADILQYHSALKSGNREVENFRSNLLLRIKSQMERESVRLKKARGIIVELTQDGDSLESEALQARFHTYFSEIKPVAETIQTLL